MNTRELVSYYKKIEERAEWNNRIWRSKRRDI